MTDIFLSYTERDRDTARRIAEVLGSAGWSVWWDRRIPAGETWRTVLDHALEDMRCMVVLWSAKSIESEWVYEEASEGRRQHKLVPVMIENVRPPAGFREIQAADLTGWDGSPDFDGLRMLLTDLENLLGKPASHAADKTGSDGPRPTGQGNTKTDGDLPYGKTELPGYSPPAASSSKTSLATLGAGRQPAFGSGSCDHRTIVAPAYRAGNTCSGTCQPATGDQHAANFPGHYPPPTASVQRKNIDEAFNKLEASRTAMEASTLTRSGSKTLPDTKASTKRGEAFRPYDHCSEWLAKIQLGETLNSVEQTIFDGKCKR